MFSTLLEGMNVLFDYRIEVFFLLLGSWSGGICFINTKALSKTDGVIKYIGAFCAGFLILTGITFLISFLSLLSQGLYFLWCYFLSFLSILVFTKNIFTSKLDFKEALYGVIATVLFLLLLAMRLPYLDYIILPSYTDSPIHYQIIKQILFPKDFISSKLAISNIFETYYHFGYHGLTAWLALSSGSAIEKSMSFVGQVSLALAPLSITFAVFMSTKNKLAALCGGVLVTFGWIMPSFAVNWGKFPALAAAATAPLMLSFMFSMFNEKIKDRTAIISIGLLFFCSAITHTRMLVLVVFIGLIIVVINALKLPEKFELRRSVLYSFLFLITLLPLSNNLSVFFNRPILGAALLFILPLAFKSYPKESSGLFFFIAAIWGSEFSSSFLSNNFSALDIQFINIYLFIPFSILGGLGVAGAMEITPTKARLFFPLAMIFVATYNSPWRVTLMPDSCCNYYTQDDEIAFEWIQQNTSESDLFIISAIESDQKHGTDAGIWIYPLAKRGTNKIAHNSKWDEGIISSCNSGKSNIYVYSGGNQYSFSPEALSNLSWIEPVFERGKIKIFKISKCPKPDT